MKYFSFGDYRLDTVKSEIRFKETALDLEPQVYCILELLITRHGDVVSRDDIIATVWDGRVVYNNVIDNRIRAARAAIGDTGKDQRYIKTYPNRGYKFIGKVVTSNEDTPSSETKNLSADKFQDTATHPNAAKRPAPSLWSKPGLRVAGVILSGLLGLYAATHLLQASSKGNTVNIEAVDDTDAYKLAMTDSSNSLPRVAILPFDTIGDRSAYGFLPDVLEGKFNQTIIAIDGITVVSLSSRVELQNDLKDYKTLRETFNIDYVINSNLSPYGEAYKLNVSLIRTEDGKVFTNEIHDIKTSDEADMKDLPAVIASKVTLMTANQLGLSVEDLPPSWEDYEFFAKIKQAEEIYENGDYESIKKATELMREAIQEEPSYVPAYSTLINMLSWKSSFFLDDYEVLFKEQEELGRKMREISPEAPETLMINAILSYIDDGVSKAELGEYIEDDPVSVAKYILKKDPDNQLAMITLAWSSEFEKEQAETIKAYEDLIRLLPTEPWVMSDYSQALFCNDEINKARMSLDRASRWHSGHRDVLLAEIKKAQALGDYKNALTKSKELLNQGYINDPEAVTLSAVFFDLGYPDLMLPHIRFPATKANVHAMMGDKEMAIKEANVIEKFYRSVLARIIAEQDYFPEDYSVYPTYSRVGEPDGVTKANACKLNDLMRDTYVLKKIGSDKFDRLLPLLTEYFKDRKPQNFETQQQYISLMGLHVLQGNKDKAIDVMDIAMERGFHFIGSFKEPHLRDLTNYPGFSERIEKMQKSADEIMKQYYSN